MTQKWNGVYYNTTSKHHTMLYYATKCLYNETSAIKNKSLWNSDTRTYTMHYTISMQKTSTHNSFHNPFFVASTGAASGGSTGGLVFRFFKPFFFIAMARWSTPLMGFKWCTINEWNWCAVRSGFIQLMNVAIFSFLDGTIGDVTTSILQEQVWNSVKHVARMCKKWRISFHHCHPQPRQWSSGGMWEICRQDAFVMLRCNSKSPVELRAFYTLTNTNWRCFACP